MDVQDGLLLTVRRDLELNIDWSDLREITLPNTEWKVIIGHKRRQDPLRVVLPLPLHTTALTPGELKSVFIALSNLSFDQLPPVLEPLAPTVAEIQARSGRTSGSTSVEPSADEVPSEEIDKEMVYMAIVTTDATVVYYRLTKGLKKPTDIPDE